MALGATGEGGIERGPQPAALLGLRHRREV
jgi:hypothetical protein